MKNKRGKAKYIAPAISNMAIVVLYCFFCVGYAQRVRSDKEAAARESFAAAVESISQLSYGYMSSLLKKCDSWAAYLENQGISMEEAIEYLKQVTINDHVSANILYYDTLTGLSTSSKNDGNNIDYSQVAEAFTYILPKMVKRVDTEYERFCKQTKLRYIKLAEEEKQWLPLIVQKSELTKSYVPQRGKKK